MKEANLAISSNTGSMRRSRKFLVILLIALLAIWVGIPLVMAVSWSLVNPDYPWSYPQWFPTHPSLAPWKHVFRYTDIAKAILTSFSIAPIVTILSFLISLPTAYAIGRRNFRGKEFVKLLILLPVVMPGMVIALFLSRVFIFLRLSQTFYGIVIAHTLLGIPFMLRILCTSFETIPQDIIDAAQGLGAGNFPLVREIYIPMVLPGLFAGSIFTFVTSLEEFNLTFIIGTPTFQTIPTVLYGFLGYYFIRTNAAVISILLMMPSLILLFFAEQYLKTEYLSAAFGKF